MNVNASVKTARFKKKREKTQTRSEILFKHTQLSILTKIHSFETRSVYILLYTGGIKECCAAHRKVENNNNSASDKDLVGMEMNDEKKIGAR